MSLRASKRIQVIVNSIIGSTAVSLPIYIGGTDLSVQIAAPAALAQIQISSDRTNWEIADNRTDGTTDLSTLASGHYEVFERPLWARLAVTDDQSGPRPFVGQFIVHTDDG